MTESLTLTAPTEATRKLDAQAERRETPLPGGGRMVWRTWGTGPSLVLLHGGHGSWMHWAAVIPYLSQRWTLVVPDLPGFGQSDDISGDPPIETIGQAVAEGAMQIIPDGPIRIAGFSFGGVLGGHVGKGCGDRLAHLVIIGSSGMKLTRPDMEKLHNWKAVPEDERDAIHRRNLGILMISPSSEITDEMVAIQRANTMMARGRSRSFSVTTTLLDVLRDYRPPLDGIWGAEDATAKGHLHERRDALRVLDPTSDFVEIPDAGHWVAMDRPEALTRALEKLLLKRMGRAGT
ncbi:alpha/beta hydrolase [Primorskyibacter flagellatus]|uniref:Alpha/beta hydrolase n=1 Tax=Primorskyibacter flagellatus TaxID=1387277 RepID=A0A917EIB8_9RHOB|nr:alpha/beta hydrolase [Primorskyibacter flagellatus]GGE46184.1 alpha/beta hydrolase [Primorskyibacter flagellatus]